MLPENTPPGAAQQGDYLPFPSYVEFLQDLFHAWWPAQRDRIVVRELADLVGQLTGAAPQICVFAGECFGAYLTVEPTGEVSACDKYIEDGTYRFGDVLGTGLTGALRSEQLALVREENRQAVERMRDCRWFGVCHGGCPHDRYTGERRLPGYDGRCCGLAPLLDDMASTLEEEGMEVVGRGRPAVTAKGGSNRDGKEGRMPDESMELKDISRDDVNAVTEKLKEWMPTLPEQEQLVMGWVLTRAAAAGDEEAEAYAERSAGTPVSALMAEAAGLQEVSGYVIDDRESGTCCARSPAGCAPCMASERRVDRAARRSSTSDIDEGRRVLGAGAQRAGGRTRVPRRAGGCARPRTSPASCTCLGQAVAVDAEHGRHRRARPRRARRVGIPRSATAGRTCWRRTGRRRSAAPTPNVWPPRAPRSTSSSSASTRTGSCGPSSARSIVNLRNILELARRRGDRPAGRGASR